MTKTIKVIKNILNPAVKYSISGNGVISTNQSSLKKNKDFKKDMETVKNLHSAK